MVVWYSLEWLQHDGLDILSYPECVGAVICMPAAAVIEVWSGTALQYSIVMDQWSGVLVLMVYWYLWWAGVVLLMVLLVVVMTEDLLLVEVLGVSIRTYSERSQRSTQEPKRDPSGPEGTARTLQATDQRPTVRSQTPALR